MPEATLEPYVSVPYDPPALDRPIGIIIAGQSQAGKSTIKDDIAWTLGCMDPSGQIPPAFPLSNGFRAVTVEVLRWWRKQSGSDLLVPSTPEACAEMANNYVDAQLQNDDEFPSRIDGYYAKKQSDSVLRTNAVDAAVPYVSENEFIHPYIIAAAGRYLAAIMHEPETVAFDHSPSAVVLDGRNAGELSGILSEGGLALGGLFVLTCNETDSVMRRLKGDESDEYIRDAIKGLKLRNALDRDRPATVGPTTEPKNVPNIISLHERINMDDMQSGKTTWNDIATLLFSFGLQVSGSIETGIHISTDNALGWNKKNVRTAVTPLIHGMVQGVRVAA